MSVLELATRVKLGEDHLDGGSAINGGVLMLHRIDGHATAVIGDGAGSIHAKPDRDLSGKTGHDLVDCVVNALVYEVVKGTESGPADVHAGTLANGFQALEDLDGLAGVFLLFGDLGLGFSGHSGFQLVCHMNGSEMRLHRRVKHGLYILLESGLEDFISRAVLAMVGHLFRVIFGPVDDRLAGGG